MVTSWDHQIVLARLVNAYIPPYHLGQAGSPYEPDHPTTPALWFDYIYGLVEKGHAVQLRKALQCHAHNHLIRSWMTILTNAVRRGDHQSISVLHEHMFYSAKSDSQSLVIPKPAYIQTWDPTALCTLPRPFTFVVRGTITTNYPLYQMRVCQHDLPQLRHDLNELYEHLESTWFTHRLWAPYRRMRGYDPGEITLEPLVDPQGGLISLRYTDQHREVGDSIEAHFYIQHVCICKNKTAYLHITVTGTVNT